MALKRNFFQPLNLLIQLEIQNCICLATIDARNSDLIKRTIERSKKKPLLVVLSMLALEAAMGGWLMWVWGVSG